MLLQANGTQLKSNRRITAHSPTLPQTAVPGSVAASTRDAHAGQSCNRVLNTCSGLHGAHCMLGDDDAQQLRAKRRLGFLRRTLHHAFPDVHVDDLRVLGCVLWIIKLHRTHHSMIIVTSKMHSALIRDY